MRVEKRSGVRAFIINFGGEVDDNFDYQNEAEIFPSGDSVMLNFTDDVSIEEGGDEGKEGGCYCLNLLEAQEIAEALLMSAETIKKKKAME